MTANKFIFYLDGSAKGSNIKFIWNKMYAIDNNVYCYANDSPHNNFSGVFVTPSENELTIDIKAKRHKTAKPACWYKESVDFEVAKMIHTKGGSAEPKELNFAIKGSLIINNEVFEICLGQGSYSGSVNNWHLCSMSIDADSNSKSGMLGGKYYLSQSGSNSFDIKCVSDMKACHDNDFILSIEGHEIEDLKFDLVDHSITSSQPFAGVCCSCDGGKGIITVKAGRKKSSAVAMWFNDQIDNNKSILGTLVQSELNGVIEKYVHKHTGLTVDMDKLSTRMIACSSIDKVPNELNFAVKGTLKCKVDGKYYTVENLLLSQGSFADLRNNWWLGSNQMYGASVSGLGGALCGKVTDDKKSSNLVIWSSFLNLSVNSISLHFIDIHDGSAVLLQDKIFDFEV
ncbi:hypothetical protein L1077_22875 [Pseudoalteromonas luteoviolacea]|uniref:hypothetical protein n=1 Tax=Pseudoalteromonas luteoviolacea TaxID=43657 RepID=UPI001F43B024|nr:hypothetical protein [Pseudoalteromonas luteoviolacea]MCF6442273.1 hypothetical protein [Pseudoalteromonas luteoviolacea]